MIPSNPPKFIDTVVLDAAQRERSNLVSAEVHDSDGMVVGVGDPEGTSGSPEPAGFVELPRMAVC